MKLKFVSQKKKIKMKFKSIFQNLKNEKNAIFIFAKINFSNYTFHIRIQFIFRFSFSRRNWKTNYLNKSRLILWLLWQVCSTSYPRASSCQVPWGFPLYNGHADTKNLLFRKQLMYFTVYIAGCYFHISFIVKVNCDKKHTSRNSHLEVF